MRPGVTLAAAAVTFALCCYATPAAPEEMRVTVRNEAGVPKVVPVRWEAAGAKEGSGVTDLQGRTNVEIDCDKTFRIFIHIDDVRARRIDPGEHKKCPTKGGFVFVVHQR